MESKKNFVWSFKSRHYRPPFCNWRTNKSEGGDEFVVREKPIAMKKSKRRSKNFGGGWMQRGGRRGGVEIGYGGVVGM